MGVDKISSKFFWSKPTIIELNSQYTLAVCNDSVAKPNPNSPDGIDGNTCS